MISQKYEAFQHASNGQLERQPNAVIL